MYIAMTAYFVARGKYFLTDIREGVGRMARYEPAGFNIVFLKQFQQPGSAYLCAKFSAAHICR